MNPTSNNGTGLPPSPTNGHAPPASQPSGSQTTVSPAHPSRPPGPRRIFVAYVEDQPGVLNRVASLFRRRSYNIISLTVGRTNLAGLSRMTIVTEADADVSRRIEANLYKLVNVVSVEDITDDRCMVRDLALIKVSATDQQRADVCQLAETFRARIVDVSDTAMTLEMTGRLDRIDALVEQLRPYGILELIQSGAIAMTRGGEAPVAAHARESFDVSDTAEVAAQ